MSNLFIGRWTQQLISTFAFVLLIALTSPTIHAVESTVPPALENALLLPVAEQPAAVTALTTSADQTWLPLLDAWLSGELYLYDRPGTAKIPFLLTGTADDAGTMPAVQAFGGAPLLDATDKPLRFMTSDVKPLDNPVTLRKAIRSLLELLEIKNSDPVKRQSAVERIGQSRKLENLPLIEATLKIEKVPLVRKALVEASVLLRLNSTEPLLQKAAIREASEQKIIAAQERIKELSAQPEGVDAETAAVATKALHEIDTYLSIINNIGSLVRGLSMGSVLLVMAIGLAITFGLMGIINMAHGEIMVVGAYATYEVQSLFIYWFGENSWAFNLYFIAAIPVSFMAAAAVGWLLERSVIQFLYRRPLESLLATWGVSMLLQQGFRQFFGPSNVKIQSPAYLMGNFVFSDIIFAYNRIFVILFAGLVVFAVWLLLTKSSLGLTIRAVMQNRQMAACLGVRSSRVNTLTFSLGSGLAGLAGACLTQLGNVGPSLGQTHIVDSFMVVVSGGVGNLVGTVVAALGIGTLNQVLEPFLGAVLGKVIVLVMIILFLQWRPGGLFPTRSRSLD